MMFCPRKRGRRRKRRAGKTERERERDRRRKRTDEERRRCTAETEEGKDGRRGWKKGEREGASTLRVSHVLLGANIVHRVLTYTCNRHSRKGMGLVRGLATIGRKRRGR